MNRNIKRCDWATKSKIEQDYHDKEWGVPVHDEKKLFKMLILEGKQAGLSWRVILSKMDTLCKAFDDFNPEIVSKYNEDKVERLLENDGIIRSRNKINAVIHNAKMYYKLCEKHNSLNEFLWSYVDFKPIVNNWSETSEVPTTTPLSDKISKDLKKIGFKFVGSTTIYAFMQGIGMVNDHLISCPAYRKNITEEFSNEGIT